MEGIAKVSHSYVSCHRQSTMQVDLLVINNTLGVKNDDTLDIGSSYLYKGLSESAKEIVLKINELLKSKLPDGLESLKPEDVTAEATAQRIVSGVTGLFEVYKEQHPELEGEELLSQFMSTIRSGVSAGYNDAFQTLEGLGAFSFDGVKQGIETTKSLIEEGLKAWEAQKKEELGITTDPVALEAGKIAETQLLNKASTEINIFV